MDQVRNILNRIGSAKAKISKQIMFVIFCLHNPPTMLLKALSFDNVPHLSIRKNNNVKTTITYIIYTT